jgi:hypothetical protein
MLILENDIKMSIRSYISSNEMTFSCKDIIKILTTRYKLTKNQIIE